MKKTITELMIMNMKKKILKPTMIFHVKRTKISSQMTITIQSRYAETITLDEIMIFFQENGKRKRKSASPAKKSSKTSKSSKPSKKKSKSSSKSKEKRFLDSVKRLKS